RPGLRVGCRRGAAGRPPPEFRGAAPRRGPGAGRHGRDAQPIAGGTLPGAQGTRAAVAERILEAWVTNRRTHGTRRLKSPSPRVTRRPGAGRLADRRIPRTRPNAHGRPARSRYP